MASTNGNWRFLASVVALVVAVLALTPLPANAQCVGADVTADVVAMDQVIVYNRLGAFNPAGMIYALARDVFPNTAVVEDFANSCASVACTPGQVHLRADKRPRPLTLRANAGQTLCIQFTNLLNPMAITDAGNAAPGIGVPPLVSEQPVTRTAGLHIHGMQVVGGIHSDASNVGLNAGSLVAPGGSTTYTVYAEKEGAYTVSSGASMGGEGGSGAIASGLFGVMNVEPAGAEWYRSQLTRAEMDMATTGFTAAGQPILDYGAVYPVGHPYAGKPILGMLDGTEIFHSDLNAVITGPGQGGFAGETPSPQYPNRGQPFREFTVAFHDEVKIVQAFPGWFNNLKFTLGSVKDGFAINYGTGGIGAEIIGNRLGVGPMHECADCKYEEFFLTSWAVGDPAMIVDVPANAGLEACDPALNNCAAVGPKATKAFYPDDPSNVWHGYLNDRTKIRNIHVGTEHHIFHLHAHQWLFAPLDSGSNYLDAQAIGPGSSFTYEIAWGGGNRNKTAGDSIFHCHFYPHFAQGMWGLWRVHDVFEQGSVLNLDGTVASRGLVDGEIAGGGYDPAGTPVAGGTPIPGLVPLPTIGMPPMPGSFVADTDGDTVPDTPFLGYPFYIPGEPGHRPPTPPLDLVADGGLPRHVITEGTVHAVQTPLNFEKELVTAVGVEVPETGTAAEKAAMAFHGPQPGGVFHSTFTPTNAPALFEVNGLPPNAGSPYAEPCRSDGSAYYGGALGTLIGNPRSYKASVIELEVQLNKVGWHFGQQRIITLDQDVADTLAGIRAPEPFVMRANTGDCVDFDHTNLVPSIYQLDDFQVKTPTDVIGQHIHLVKFDVMSADGAANGWNYEDGTMSPNEIQERIAALNGDHALPGDPFGLIDLGGGVVTNLVAAPFSGPCPPATVAAGGCQGARTTRQRWHIDPIYDDSGYERGLGNVFTHDHYGPSTHQQVGLYATLLVEPEGSQWRDPETGVLMGSRPDGGPTSWRADIIPPDPGDAYREFYLEFGDFQLAYRGAAGDGGLLNGPNTPVNPSDRIEPGLPFVLQPNPATCGVGQCRPEAISAADPGTFVVNYRNEPLALRVRDPATNAQAPGLAGDLAYAFSSTVTRADARLNTPPAAWPYGVQTATSGALTGDPFTPTLRVYEGDPVSLRVQVGAHEEGHNFSMNGIRWLQSFGTSWSGYRSSQMMGISEYFRFEVPGISSAKGSVGFEDYMYQTGASVDARWNGTWGLMRAYDDLRPDLLPLPNNPDGKAPSATGGAFQGVCPRGAPSRKYTVVAARAADILPGGTLVYNPGPGAAGPAGPLHDPTALLYVLKEDIDKQTGMLAAGRRVEPLILRAAAGECLDITLENLLPAALHGPDPAFPLTTADLAGFNLLPMIVNDFNANQLRPSSNVGLHAQLVEYDMTGGDGMNVGFNPMVDAKGNLQTTAGPGQTVKYRWYAGRIDQDDVAGTLTAVPVEFGAINLMGADPIKHSNKGLIGALIVEPVGSLWAAAGEVGTDGLLTRSAVTVTHPGGSFRDFVGIFQDDVNGRFADGSPVPTVSEEEEPEDSGMKGLNYRTDPIWFRLPIGPTADPQVTRLVDFTDAFAGDPVTPIFTAAPCEEIRFRVLKPGGHNRNSVFTLHGHLWARHPFNQDSTVIGANLNTAHTFWHGEQMGHGASNHINVIPLHGAGGVTCATGDYLYRDMTPVHAYNGEWGVVRVQ